MHKCVYLPSANHTDCVSLLSCILLSCSLTVFCLTVNVELVEKSSYLIVLSIKGHHMADTIEVNCHFGGQWSFNPHLEYLNGDVETVVGIDPDLLCYRHIRERQMLDYIRNFSWVSEIDIYADHDVDMPIYQNRLLSLDGAPVQPQGLDDFIENEEFVDLVNEDIDGENARVTDDNNEGIDSEHHVGVTDRGNEDTVGENERVVGCEDENIGGGNERVIDDQNTRVEAGVNDDTDGSSEEEDTDSSSSEGEGREKVQFKHREGVPQFMLSMTFADAKEVRVALAKYAVSKGVKLKIKPNETTRIRARCVSNPGCPFVILISKEGKNPGLKVKTLNLEHDCYRVFENPACGAKFITMEMKRKLYRKPDMPAKDLKYALVMQELNGSYKVEYGYLEAYDDVLRRTNPGTTAHIELCGNNLREGKRVFNRMFICFDACKKCWLSGCRTIIGLDGCFLKGICKGQLLSAVGKDGNNQMYPIAWAIIDKDNTRNWRWFIKLLATDLQLGEGS
ncbi:uncharacterized protein LOC126661469 [Mercurialis annua]|uniref:uncharacterized protein LOC126661469 n=1 Tax=Mercurialis annua TaxID=3986 RepID=UPI0021601F2C|nr:uncharacterized protein LOC126661469 [Mercurialis annua]